MRLDKSSNIYERKVITIGEVMREIRGFYFVLMESAHFLFQYSLKDYLPIQF